MRRTLQILGLIVLKMASWQPFSISFINMLHITYFHQYRVFNRWRLCVWPGTGMHSVECMY